MYGTTSKFAFYMLSYENVNIFEVVKVKIIKMRRKTPGIYNFSRLTAVQNFGKFNLIQVSITRGLIRGC